MNKYIPILLLSLLTTSCGKDLLGRYTGKKIEFIKFYSDHCPACVEFEPILRKVKPSFPDLIFYDVNVINDRATTDSFHIKAYPTCVILVDGKAHRRFIGYKSEKHLTTILKRYKVTK